MSTKKIQLLEPIYKKPVVAQDTQPDDTNVLWVDTSDDSTDGIEIFPSGGTVGQVLTKTANGQEWADNNSYEIIISSSTTTLPDVVNGAILIAYDA